MAKILILANSDLGLYKFRKELIEELLKDNEVFISLPDGGFIKDLVNLGCNFIETQVDRRGLNPILDLILMFNYNKLIKNIKPNLVITYTIKPNIYGGFMSKANNIDYVSNITGLGTAFQKRGMLNKLVVKLYTRALNKSKVVFFENEENRQTFINRKILSEEKTFKLNGAGVNLEEYKFTSYPKTDNGIRFLFIGRVMREKGINELLSAAQRIKSEYHDVEFDIIGPEEDSYLNILSNLHENRTINYYGYQSDVKPFIERAHCFVLPSYHEGMANTLLESGAIGRPLITSNIFGCKEAVIEGENGYLVPVGDSEYLYRVIKKFIETSQVEKIRMAENSRKLIEIKFDKKDIVNKTIWKIL